MSLNRPRYLGTYCAMNQIKARFYVQLIQTYLPFIASTALQTLLMTRSFLGRLYNVFCLRASHLTKAYFMPKSMMKEQWLSGQFKYF